MPLRSEGTVCYAVTASACRRLPPFASPIQPRSEKEVTLTGDIPCHPLASEMDRFLTATGDEFFAMPFQSQRRFLKEMEEVRIFFDL